MSAFRAQLSVGAPPPAAFKRTGLRRQVFDCGGSSDLPGDPVRMEGEAGGRDAAADEAYGHLKTTWDFFKTVFGRESVDNSGKTLVASVHFSRDYLNAFWNGQQMVFGDGDGKTLTHFTGSLDVIAHELTHGVTGFSAQLSYEGQTGALNESMSDVFGSLVKQWSLGQTVEEADWLIGAGVLGTELRGKALRNMAAPGTAFEGDEQPGHMDNYLQTEDDHGGVHINSGIPNRAFVLAARAIGGNAWEKAGLIWYKTLTERLTANADFAKCAIETVSVARDLFPGDSSIAAKVAEAWVKVGVLAAAPVSVAAPPVIRVAASVAAPVTMGEAALAQSFAQTGNARVLVSLNPEPAGFAAAFSGDDRRQLEAELARFFIDPAPEALTLSASVKRKGRPAAQASGMKMFHKLGIALGSVNAQGASGLRAHRRVKSVLPAPTPSLVVPVLVKSAKAPSGVTWGLKRINAPAVWEKGFTGKGVIVGHLDTGVDGDHPALKDAVADFAEFDFAGNRVERIKAYDSARHGTHTAGTIVGRNVGRGAVGVAPGAKIVSAHCIEGGQVIDRILAGLEWIVEKRARVLSMSVGLPGAYSPAFEELIAALRRNAVLPVIAIGNEGAGSSRSPGNYSNVLSVGAIDERDFVAGFSSSQSFARAEEPQTPLLVAPGVDVNSCVPGGGYDLDSGTSMATPHVAGLAALLFEASPGATIDDVEQAILNSCALPRTMTPARAGRGVPDALRALQNLVGPPRVAARAPARARARARA